MCFYADVTYNHMYKTVDGGVIPISSLIIIIIVITLGSLVRGGGIEKANPGLGCWSRAWPEPVGPAELEQGAGVER